MNPGSGINSRTKLNVLILFCSLVIRVTDCVEEEYIRRMYKWSQGLDKWEPTQEMKDDMPIYHSGYDYEGKPVVVIELGKWKVQKYSSGKKPGNAKLLMLRTEKAMWNVLTSPKYNNDTENGFVLIVDGTGLAVSKIRDHKCKYDVKLHLLSTKKFFKFNERVTIAVTVIQFHLKAILFLEAMSEYLAEVYLINVNSAFEVLIHAVRPFAPKLFATVELIGTNQEKIISSLRRFVPKDQLTPRYGGNEDFKPVSVF